jgi:hypothetical protein
MQWNTDNKVREARRSLKKACAICGNLICKLHRYSLSYPNRIRIPWHRSCVETVMQPERKSGASGIKRGDTVEFIGVAWLVARVWIKDRREVATLIQSQKGRVVNSVSHWPTRRLTLIARAAV